MEGWLTRIATNTCLNIIRSAKRRPELVTADLTDNEVDWLEKKVSRTASGHPGGAERNLVVADLAARVLETLAPEDRLALTMIDGEDASVSEVAQLTGWSESKVKVRAFRARRKAREALEKLLGRNPTVRERVVKTESSRQKAEGRNPTVREGAENRKQ